MDESDYGELNSLMSSVVATVDDDAVGLCGLDSGGSTTDTAASDGDKRFQDVDKLGQQFQTAQQQLGKIHNQALDMVKGLLKSTRLRLEDELVQLRSEKQTLAAELASLRSEHKRESSSMSHKEESLVLSPNSCMSPVEGEGSLVGSVAAANMAAAAAMAVANMEDSSVAEQVVNSCLSPTNSLPSAGTLVQSIPLERAGSLVESNPSSSESPLGSSDESEVDEVDEWEMEQQSARFTNTRSSILGASTAFMNSTRQLFGRNSVLGPNTSLDAFCIGKGLQSGPPGTPATTLTPITPNAGAAGSETSTPVTSLEAAPRSALKGTRMTLTEGSGLGSAADLRHSKRLSTNTAPQQKRSSQESQSSTLTTLTINTTNGSNLLSVPGSPRNAEQDARRGSTATSCSRRDSRVSIMVQPGQVVAPGEEMKKESKKATKSPSGRPRLSTLGLGSGITICEEESDGSTDSSSKPEVRRSHTGLLEEDEYPILDVWTKKNEDSNNAGTKDMRVQRKMSIMMFDTSNIVQTELMTLRDDDDEDWNCLVQCFRMVVLSPNSMYRALWDISSFILLAYDMITVPLLGAFDPPQSDPFNFIIFMIWFTRLFWTIDMFVSCLTGFMKTDGVVEMRPVQIWKRYARTWFVLDAALVGIDWAELFVSMDSTADIARFGKASRGFRILRLLRLLRMLRFGQLVQLLDERIRSDRLMICADILKIVLVILICAHFAACAWYGIGSMDDSPSWVQVNFNEHSDALDRYALSLHWSLAQFAGGMDEVVPINISERLFAVVLFVLAFMMAAVLVSSLTSEITRLQIISNTHAQQMNTLRRFLIDNNVTTKLAVRVQRNAKHSLQEQQRHIPEASVELLQMVSEPLRMELHFEIQAPMLSKHPFFNRYIEECPHIMRKVCHKCTRMTACFTGDVIFNPGEAPRPPKMYFVANGMFEYFLMSGHQVRVQQGSWLSEPVIWTNWLHKGGLRAKSDSHLCELLATEFQEVCIEFDHTFFDPRTYGQRFCELLNMCEGSVSDLPMPKEQLEDASNFGRAPSFRDTSALVRRGSGGRLRWN